MTQDANPLPPPRLFVFLAREAPVGLILRRGPTRWVHLIRWDTANDVFEPGAWFRGRIYEERCDLSPDGTKFLYFTRKNSPRDNGEVKYTSAWTAVSKTPWVTALALWPNGDTYGGGGIFETNSRILLNHFSMQLKPHPDHMPVGLEVVPNSSIRVADPPAYYRRLTRDG